MHIIPYPHSTLRRKAKLVKRVDSELRNIIHAMFDLMYEARGIGLAANQVDIPLRFFIINTDADPNKGEERVFINPVITQPKGFAEAEEGCLSLPGLYGNVTRPKQVRINAYDLEGREINEELTGLLARAAQHELDHLDGVLFIDRMTETGKFAAQDALHEFEIDFMSKRKTGSMPEEKAIEAQWADWEKRYG
ncbi:MAG TPA: peptide deformylase [Pirellulaceae bacterium]|nr:peptide deformylase [Pirellulaceae bacterium]